MTAFGRTADRPYKVVFMGHVTLGGCLSRHCVAVTVQGPVDDALTELIWRKHQQMKQHEIARTALADRSDISGLSMMPSIVLEENE